MTKTVRKLRPADFWKVGEHESWFSDMSQEGLHIYEIGTHFAKFKKGERKQMEYRLELAKDKYISNEKIDLYKENGWDYIASDRYFHIFAAPTERKTKEVEVHSVEYMAVLKSLQRKMLLNLLVTVGGVALILFVLYRFWFLDNTKILLLIDGGLEVTLILAVINSLYIISAFKSWWGITRVRKKFIEGELIDHHKSWELSFLYNKITYIFNIVITIIALIIPIYQITKIDHLTLPKEDTSLPIVRLESIENNPHLVRKEWGNYVSVNWSAFAPVIYETVENGEEKTGEWTDPNNTYTPIIYSNIYQLRFQFLVDPLVKDLIKESNYESNDKKIFTERTHEKFDHLLIHEGDKVNEFIFVKDNAVMYISYNGQVKADVIIDQAADKISLLTNK